MDKDAKLKEMQIQTSSIETSWNASANANISKRKHDKHSQKSDAENVQKQLQTFHIPVTHSTDF